MKSPLRLFIVAGILAGAAYAGQTVLPSSSFGPYSAVSGGDEFTDPDYILDWKVKASNFRAAPGTALAALPAPQLKMPLAEQLSIQAEIIAAAAHAEQLAEARYPMSEGDDTTVAEHRRLFKTTLQSYLLQIAKKHEIGLTELMLIRDNTFEYFEIISSVAP